MASRKTTGSTTAQTFGPWMLSAHVRRKQQAQVIMNWKAISLEVNRRLSEQIDKDRRAEKNRVEKNSNPMTDGSPCGRYQSTTGTM